jgi:lysyl-tRNA synthetase class 2
MADELWRLKNLKRNLQRRALVYDLTRAFFRERGFLEVETPTRMPAPAPERHITPYPSEHWFLATSPELHMKRLLAAGYDRIFQLSRCFRKGERGRQHNPEFTMLEWYRLGGDFRQMIDDTEELVVTLVNRIQDRASISYQGHDIDLTRPWQRLTVREAFLSAAGWDPIAQPDSSRFDTDFAMKVIPGLPKNRPAVLTSYPAATASLARLSRDEPGTAERAEVFIGGLELANAYSELNDCQEQARRFAGDIESIRRERGQEMPLPDRFLETLNHLPDCGGIALGMDRLVMLLCDAGSIDDVLAFTVDTA